MASVLVRLSTLELARPNGKLRVLTTGEVDRLLRSAYQLRSLGDGVALHGRPTDVAIEIARDRDGSVVVFPRCPRRHKGSEWRVRVRIQCGRGGRDRASLPPD